jgi:carbon-monoxide dehydrogenase medium subunit
VIPAPFDYVRPGSVEEAVAALSEAGEDAKILAGGQSLIPVLRLRLGAPSVLIDLGGIAELRRISDDGDRIAIGAMAPHHEVLHDELVRRHVGLLSDATATVADNQTRHRGTLGGALAHADPAGDLGGVALALDAEFVIAGPSGLRTVGADEFFVDYFTTALGEDEILTEVRFPKYTGWGSHYEKFNRTAQSWSMVAIAAAVRTEGGTIAEARVGLTNMGTTPLRARGVEQALVGQPATAEAVRAAAERVTEGTAAPSDADAAADYREHLARVLTGRAVLAAAG